MNLSKVFLTRVQIVCHVKVNGSANIVTIEYSRIIRLSLKGGTYNIEKTHLRGRLLVFD